jgi:hypothetical protein
VHPNRRQIVTFRVVADTEFLVVIVPHSVVNAAIDRNYPDLYHCVATKTTVTAAVIAIVVKRRSLIRSVVVLTVAIQPENCLQFSRVLRNSVHVPIIE